MRTRRKSLQRHQKETSRLQERDSLPLSRALVLVPALDVMRTFKFKFLIHFDVRRLGVPKGPGSGRVEDPATHKWSEASPLPTVTDKLPT